MKFELCLPAKPFIVRQAWGIYNPAYTQFGFDHHNGVDFAIGKNNLLYAPIRLKVIDVGFNSGAGNYIRFVTTDRFDVLGADCLVGGMFMHMEKQYVKTGDIVEVGTCLGIPDNTGFSTGPHTHFSVYRLKAEENIPENRLDTDTHTNQTFDPSPFFNGTYAQDVPIISIQQSVVALLQKLINLLQK